MGKVKYLDGGTISDFEPMVAPIEWWEQNGEKWSKSSELGNTVKNTEPLQTRVERIDKLPYYLKVRMEIFAKYCIRTAYNQSALHLELQLCEIVADLDKEYPANDINERPEIPGEVIVQKILKSDFSCSEFMVASAEMIIRRYLYYLACDSLSKPALDYAKCLNMESMPMLRKISNSLIRSYKVCYRAGYIKDYVPRKK
ncbi:MAG: hypothetical protein IJX20_05285 [Alphaproteobacteria bacterium]|nr:hypothetical protein [Alphaproteobacteria bacterium]